MKKTLFTNLNTFWRQANQWLLETPERSLDQAYRAALTIKAIEDEHFGGKKIAAKHSEYRENVTSLFQADLKKYLIIAKVRVAEFRASRSMTNLSEQTFPNRSINVLDNGNPTYSVEARENQAIIIEKLNFIDGVLARYKPQADTKASSSLVPVASSNAVMIDENALENTRVTFQPISSTESTITEVESPSDQTGVLPRSIWRTLNRIKQELDPQAEEEVIKNFRTSKLKTIISAKLILLLILVPLLTQSLSKNLIIGPIVDTIRGDNAAIFLNVDLEEEAFTDLERFERTLKFENLIGLAERSPSAIEEELKLKAAEIKEEYSHKSANAIKNVFADILSLIAFGAVIIWKKRDIAILKSFMDEAVYGLSDSAKAFIIILFTDIFVGFHSPHGWEVLLSSTSKHLGIPENAAFIGLFIATFPVILDTIFKYWIFRYLNRISPSAVATYKNMNE